jgi:hypothetical protein
MGKTDPGDRSSTEHTTHHRSSALWLFLRYRTAEISFLSLGSSLNSRAGRVGVPRLHASRMKFSNKCIVLRIYAWSVSSLIMSDMRAPGSHLL